MAVVEGLTYTKDHEWVKIEGDTATIGITDYAQEMLGELTFVELPAVGDEFAAGESFGSAESSKAASDIYCSVAGKVTEVNALLESQPELINNDCYGQGWICKMVVTGKDSVEALMTAKEYEDYLREL